MAEDSVVLIADFIVPNPVPADEIGAVSASLAMMTPAGKERTIDDFQKVLNDAGLQLSGVFKPEDGDFGLIEATLKPHALSVETSKSEMSSREASPAR